MAARVGAYTERDLSREGSKLRRKAESVFVRKSAFERVDGTGLKVRGVPLTSLLVAVLEARRFRLTPGLVARRREPEISAGAGGALEALGIIKGRGNRKRGDRADTGSGHEQVSSSSTASLAIGS